MKMHWWLAALSLMVPRPAAATCPAASPGPAGAVDLAVGAEMRTFVVRVPSGYDRRTPAPVVFVFHPGGNAEYMLTRVNIPKAWPEAIGVYPRGLARSPASDLQPIWQTRKGELQDRDLAFFDAMMGWLREHHCIDERRVFSMGFSNGAMLTSLLSCERSRDIAGFAMVAGSTTCSPAAAKPAIIIHGLADLSVQYERGVAMVQEWTTRNGCLAPPRTATVACSAATSCLAPVVLCTHAGGHVYEPQFTKDIIDVFKAAGRKP
jgi:polyhydroxybutyrate depolymerase